MLSPSIALQAVNTVLATADRLGANVPKDVVDEHDSIKALVDRARSFTSELGRDNVAVATVDALEAGRDPYDDPAVLKAIVTRELADSTNGLDVAIGERSQQFARDSALALVAAFGDPFDAAAAAITNAVKHLGATSIEEPAAIASLGPRAAAAWAEVVAAEDAIRQIVQAWKLLSQMSPDISHDPRYTQLITTDIPAEAFVDERLGGVHTRPWDAVRRGWTLAYCTDPAIYRQRTQAVAAELARKQAEAERGYQRAHQRSSGNTSLLPPAA